MPVKSRGQPRQERVPGQQLRRAQRRQRRTDETGTEQHHGGVGSGAGRTTKTQAAARRGGQVPAVGESELAITRRSASTTRGSAADRPAKDETVVDGGDAEGPRRETGRRDEEANISTTETNGAQQVAVQERLAAALSGPGRTPAKGGPPGEVGATGPPSREAIAATGSVSQGETT